MTPEGLFSVANGVAVGAWLVLIVVPRRRIADVVALAVAALLAGTYVVLVAVFLPQAQGGFSSLAGVGRLFANPWALVAGWTHYLAFDLLVGRWEAQDAERRGMRRLFVVPALILTFLLGPAGWLLYLALRRN